MVRKLALFWVSPLLLIARAAQNCSPEQQPIVTSFNFTEEDYELSVTRPDSLTNYTDRQLGIFRLAHSVNVNNLIRFNLIPLTARVSMVSFSCVEDPHCVTALVLPNPWNPPDLLTKTLRFNDVEVHGPRFTAFDNEWSTIRMTNSSGDGRIDVHLCAGQSFVTLIPASDNFSSGSSFPSIVEMLSPPNTNFCWDYSRDIQAEWKIPCQTLRYLVTPLAEQIDAALDRRQYQHSIKLVAIYVVAAVVLVALFYAVVIKFVQRSCLELRSDQQK